MASCEAMTDEPNNVVLRLLRELRAGQERISDRIDALTTRVAAVESTLSFIVTHITIHTRLDRVENRLDRIEKHFESVP
jgi:hypothetical protein